MKAFSKSIVSIYKLAFSVILALLSNGLFQHSFANGALPSPYLQFDSLSLGGLIKLRDKIIFTAEAIHNRNLRTVECFQTYSPRTYSPNQVKLENENCYLLLSDTIKKVRTYFKPNRALLGVISIENASVLSLAIDDLFDPHFRKLINLSPSNLFTDKYLSLIDPMFYRNQPLDKEEVIFAKNLIRTFFDSKCLSFKNNLEKLNIVFEKNQNDKNLLINNFCSFLSQKTSMSVMNRFLSGRIVLETFLKYFKDEYLGSFKVFLNHKYIEDVAIAPYFLFIRDANNVLEALPEALSKAAQFSKANLDKIKSEDQNSNLPYLISRYKMKQITESEVQQLKEGISFFFEFKKISKWLELEENERELYSKMQSEHEKYKSRLNNLKMLGLVGLSLICLTPNSRALNLISAVLKSSFPLYPVCLSGSFLLSANLYSETIQEYSRVYDLFFGTTSSRDLQESFSELSKKQQSIFIDTLVFGGTDFKMAVEYIRSLHISQFAKDNLLKLINK